MTHGTSTLQASMRRRGRATLLVGAAALAITGCGGGGSGGADSSVATTASTDVTTEPATTESSGTTEVATDTTVPDTSTATTEVVVPIDWGNLTYGLECGAAAAIELTDGTFRPEQYNSDLESLIVELRSADPLPARADVTIVHLSCQAGGATGALSTELYAVMDTSAGGAAPALLTHVVAEPGAVGTITDDGTVVIDDTTYGADDPNCCPSVFRSRQIVWGDDGLPVVVEGSRPDTPATPPPTGQACVATELDAASADPSQALLLEQALAVAGFDPGPVDGVLDAAAMNAVVRLIEFNADNPELHSGPNAPYTNLHAEARDHGVVRTPVLDVLGIGCPDIAQLPAR